MVAEFDKKSVKDYFGKYDKSKTIENMGGDKEGWHEAKQFDT